MISTERTWPVWSCALSWWKAVTESIVRGWLWAGHLSFLTSLKRAQVTPALVSFHRILWNTEAPCLADAANLVQPLVNEGTWSRQPAMGLSASTRDTASGGFMRANDFVVFPILFSHILRWPEYSLHHGSQHFFPELWILNFWLSNFSHLSWWDPGGSRGVFSTVNVPLCLGFLFLCSFESCC